MRRPKLEIYIAILKALEYYGPLRLTKITCKANVNCSLLKEVLRSFIDNNLVEERKLNKAIVYALTPKARWILSKFKEFNQSLPVSEETLIE
jgi:predicted transcriptional regulator